jgi:hypothetical protein
MTTANVDFDVFKFHLGRPSSKARAQPRPPQITANPRADDRARAVAPRARATLDAA